MLLDANDFTEILVCKQQKVKGDYCIEQNGLCVMSDYYSYSKHELALVFPG